MTPLRIRVKDRAIQFIPIRLLLKALTTKSHIRDLLTQELEDREFMRLVIYQGFLSLFGIFAHGYPTNTAADI